MQILFPQLIKLDNEEVITIAMNRLPTFYDHSGWDYICCIYLFLFIGYSVGVSFTKCL